MPVLTCCEYDNDNDELWEFSNPNKSSTCWTVALEKARKKSWSLEGKDETLINGTQIGFPLPVNWVGRILTK